MHAARARTYTLMARASLWLARSFAAQFGAASHNTTAVVRNTMIAQTYREMAKEERARASVAFEEAFG